MGITTALASGTKTRLARWVAAPRPRMARSSGARSDGTLDVLPRIIST